jgi:hypothetical protein
MSCKPSQLRKGDKIQMQSPGKPYTCFFVRREPRECGRPARNVLFSPDWVGLNGTDDKGEAVCSDYELSRKGTVLEAA